MREKRGTATFPAQEMREGGRYFPVRWRSAAIGWRNIMRGPE